MNSSSVGSISAALVKAQQGLGHAIKSSTNPHFKSKYADLASVIDAVKGPLNDNGIAFSQASVVRENLEVVLVTTLLHTSGEFLQSEYPLRPSQPTPQGFGSALTYARRYCLASIVGIASEEDDDGNEASKPSYAPYASPCSKKPALLGLIGSLISDTGTDIDKVLAAYKKPSLEHLTDAEANDLATKLRAKPRVN